jgi:hypothetical protein
MIAGQSVYSHSCMLKIEEATQDTTTETKELASILLNIAGDAVAELATLSRATRHT